MATENVLGVMDAAECGELMGLSVKQLEHLRARHAGPPFFRLGRAIRYRRSAVLDWIVQQEQESRKGTAA